MDLQTISARVASLKGAVDTIRAVVGAKTQIEADSRIAGAFEQLGRAQETFMEMRNSMYDLQEEIRTLKDRLREQEQWSDRASKYQLVVAPGGARVWSSGDPIQHYACPVCFEEKKIQFLQDNGSYAGTWGCRSCRAQFSISSGR